MDEYDPLTDSNGPQFAPMAQWLAMVAKRRDMVAFPKE